jgi:hypothetical protein
VSDHRDSAVLIAGGSPRADAATVLPPPKADRTFLAHFRKTLSSWLISARELKQEASIKLRLVVASPVLFVGGLILTYAGHLLARQRNSGPDKRGDQINRTARSELSLLLRRLRIIRV